MNMKSNVLFSKAMIAVFTFHLIFVFSLLPFTLFPQAIKQYYFYIYYLLINGAVFIILPYC